MLINSNGRKQYIATKKQVEETDAAMFDEYGNYIPNDEEAIEFEEFDMDEE